MNPRFTSLGRALEWSKLFVCSHTRDTSSPKAVHTRPTASVRNRMTKSRLSLSVWCPTANVRIFTRSATLICGRLRVGGTGSSLSTGAHPDPRVHLRSYQLISVLTYEEWHRPTKMTCASSQ